MTEKVSFNYEDDIINPCWDNVFKATFTRDTPESRGALEYLLSAIIKRDVTLLTIIANEPPVESINERQIRYDIHCKFNNDEPCNIEMTLNPDAFELIRLEYYASKLYTTHEIRGRDKAYRDIENTYQIALLVNAPMIKDDVFVHTFKYYDDENGISLGGKSHIITIELAKLEKIAQKPVSEMTALERWAVFFRYTPEKSKRELVNEVIKFEEGIAMAGQVLLTISKDEQERARLLSEYKFAVDLQSKMVDARREGVVEGREEGREEGSISKAIEIARNLLLMKLPLEQIASATGLTLKEVKEISV